MPSSKDPNGSARKDISINIRIKSPLVSEARRFVSTGFTLICAGIQKKEINFLCVALEHLKRLEGEVNEALGALGETQQALHETGLTIDPHQLLGIELNPRAAHITDLVLWLVTSSGTSARGAPPAIRPNR